MSKNAFNPQLSNVRVNIYELTSFTKGHTLNPQTNLNFKICRNRHNDLLYKIQFYHFISKVYIYTSINSSLYGLKVSYCFEQYLCSIF